MRRFDHTPTSTIKNALRVLSMRCRERNDALRDANRTCAKCGRKASVAKGKGVKVQAHHKRQPNWERIIAAIREELLQTKEGYEILCCECHKSETEKQQEEPK